MTANIDGLMLLAKLGFGVVPPDGVIDDFPGEVIGELDDGFGVVLVRGGFVLGVVPVEADTVTVTFAGITVVCFDGGLDGVVGFVGVVGEPLALVSGAILVWGGGCVVATSMRHTTHNAMSRNVVFIFVDFVQLPGSFSGAFNFPS